MEAIDKIEICKLVAGAIMADAQITDDEREFLTKLMDRYGLSESERAEVMKRNIGEDPAVGVNALGSDEARNELIVELALAVAVDGQVSSSETKMLQRVADTLDITAEEMTLMLKAALA